MVNIKIAIKTQRYFLDKIIFWSLLINFYATIIHMG